MGADYKKKQSSMVGGRGDGNQGANLTRYYNPNGGNVPNPAELNMRCRMPFDCLITHLWARSAAPPGAGETYIYTLMLNGVATALAVTIVNPNEVAGPDLDAIAIAAGDDISMRVVSSLNAAVTEHSWSFEVQT